MPDNDDKKRRSMLDDVDKKILDILQKDCQTSLSDIAVGLEIPKSTVHYRIKRLVVEKIISGYHAKVNFSKLGDDFQAIIQIRAKYSKDYVKEVGEMLSKIPGIWAVYNVLGEYDFVVMMRAVNREELMNQIEKMRESGQLERTNTTVIARIIKEGERLFSESKEE